MDSIRVSVLGDPRDRASWLELAGDVERSGFDGLYVGDHPGVAPAPFVALAAAAAVTDRIQLGTCVVNAGAWEPLALANQIATLDVLSSGRAVLGVGAGHTPSEWTSTGRPFPRPGERVDRMIALANATLSLLAGEPVSMAGPFVLDEVLLDKPRPIRDPVPLLVGGNGSRVLRYGGEHAQRVSISGLARTLEDGHQHEVDWTTGALDRAIESIELAAEAAGRHPQIEALVQHVEVTDDAARSAARLVSLIPGASTEDLLHSPYVWLGTIDEIRARLAEHRRHHGIDRYMIRERSVGQARTILQAPSPNAS